MEFTSGNVGNVLTEMAIKEYLYEENMRNFHKKNKPNHEPEDTIIFVDSLLFRKVNGLPDGIEVYEKGMIPKYGNPYYQH